jgi:hypothetical protein
MRKSECGSRNAEVGNKTVGRLGGLEVGRLLRIEGERVRSWEVGRRKAEVAKNLVFESV